MPAVMNLNGINPMKKVIFIILFSMPVFCNADEYFRFANIVCLEDAGFFEVYGTGILNIRAYSKSEKIVKDIESKSNLIYGKDVVEKSCKLHGGLFEVKIEYTKASERGRCMGNPGAWLTLKKNGKVLIDKVSFDWSCDWPDIKRLTVNSGQFVEICGTNYSTASYMKNAFCITDFEFPSDGTPVTNRFIKEISESQFNAMRKMQ